MIMMLVILVLCSLVSPAIVSNAPGSSLRLYDSFAEIYRLYNGPLRFRQTDWDNIKHESLIVRSSSPKSNDTTLFERKIVRVNANMTGKAVFVRKFPEHTSPVLCEIIHEDHTYSVVREIETGRYFRAQPDLIEYPEEPQTDLVYEVSFQPTPSNTSLSVTYVVNNLRWQTRYTLQTFPNGHTQFRILADIINSSPMTYQFNQTDLMSGDINLAFGMSRSSPLIIGTTSSKKSNFDYSGIHLFSSINSSLTIDPYSMLTLPIRSPKIRIKVLLAYTLMLTVPLPPINGAASIVSSKHKFQRLYQMSNSSSFLPTGHLLLYDSPYNVLTGEWHLPTLAEAEKYEFELGQDADVMLVCNRTTTTNRATNTSITTTHVLIQNYKQRQVNVRFKSLCQLTTACLFYDDKARSLGPRLRYDLVLKAKSEVAFTFTAVRLYQLKNRKYED